MASIQFGASVAKELFAVLGVLELTFVRLGIAAMIMAFILRARRARITATNWQWPLVYGASLAGMNIMFYLAIQMLPLGIAAGLVRRRTVVFTIVLLLVTAMVLQNLPSPTSSERHQAMML